VLVAETQAQIGYVLQQELRNILEKPVGTLITQVRVDAHDPAFENPTKPVGPYYDADTARSKPFQTRLITRSDGRSMYRRVVPSPAPIEIIESSQIESLLEDGTIIITVGGGGIPVVRERGSLRGVEAVIDKDLASAVLGKEIGADTLLVLTDVEFAYLDFGESSQRPLHQVTPAEMREYLDAGEFATGSMGPKVEAAIEFVESGGDRAIITAVDYVDDALDGESGTEILEA
jgi:carbamate kinase